jgi:prolipoprotein diacylglyceryltransferase
MGGGQVAWLYLVLYASARFAIEFFRDDNPHILLGLTVSQAVSLLALLGALPLAYFIWSNRGRDQAHADAGGEPHG